MSTPVQTEQDRRADRAGRSVQHRASERSIAARRATLAGEAATTARAGRLTRYLTALVVICAAFWAYRTFAAPFIEPKIAPQSADYRVPRSTENGPGLDLSPIDFPKHFPEGAWQLNAKVLETRYGALVFGDDIRDREDGVDRIVLRPVTLLFVADAEGGHWGERPIILDAPEGIEIITSRDDEGESSDREAPSPLSMGAPVAGRLLGAVTIQRASAPGKQDGFRLITRNVQIDEERIATPYQVELAMGRNYLIGSDLEILLTDPDASEVLDNAEGESMALEVGGRPFPVQSLELVKVDKVVVYVDESKGGDASPAGMGTPVEITAAGPLNLDLAHGKATLERKVTIARIGREGPPDTLQCERVEAEFGMAGEGAKLKLDRVVASGYPVRLVSPRQKAEAWGEQLIFDMDQSMLSLVGTRGVQMTQDGRQVRATRVDYKFDMEDPGRIGQLWAQGPGELSGHLGANQPFSARWQEMLKIAPQEQQQVISLFGGVFFGAGLAGQFQSQQLHFYLNEVERPPTPERPKPKREFLPDRLHATGNVRVQSPQMNVATNEIQAWFQPQVGQPVAQPKKGEMGLRLGDPDPASSPKVEASGRIVQLQLRYDSNLNVSLDELQVQGDVDVRRQPTRSAEGRLKEGFHLRGDALAIGGIDVERLRVKIVGRPARMDLGDGHVESGSVTMDQAANRLEAAGVGNLSLVQKKKDAHGHVTKGPPIHVAWQQGLTFDGGRLSLNGGVRVFGSRLLKDGERMEFHGGANQLEAVLARGYSFADLDRLSEQKLEIAEVILRGKVQFNGKTMEGNVQTSYDRMEVGEVQFNPQTHVVQAMGPGWLSSIRTKLKADDERQDRAGAAAPRAAANLTAKPNTMHYMRIEFEDQLQGNAKLRDLVFSDRVRCVYGQVERWDEVVEDGTNRGGRGGELTCRTLRIAEVPRDRERAMVLDAQGNIYIKSQQFDAHAARLTYDQLRDLMVLHGDPRGGANLRYAAKAGGAAIPMNAQRIKFWPKTLRVEVEGFNSITAPLGAAR